MPWMTFVYWPTPSKTSINENIKTLSEGLALDGRTDDQEPEAIEMSIERASAFRSLAFAYWELVYLELAEGKIRNFCLEQTIEHAERALHYLQDAPVAVLLARAYLQSGDTQAASRALETAAGYGMNASVLAPHRAEIAFTEARYSDITNTLEGLSSEKFEALNEVCNYWEPVV